jgi:hypothetical protein
MPFDGRETAVTEALDRLSAFFSDEKYWYHADFCKRRRRHSYRNGQMCLRGAVMAEMEKGAPVALQVFIEWAIKRRTQSIMSIECFNGLTSHKGLLAMLADAKVIAIDEAKARIEEAQRRAEWEKIEAHRSLKVAEDERQERAVSMELLLTMRPIAAVRGETGLIADMTLFFDDPRSRPCGPQSGVRLGQVLHYFRKARGLRGDNTVTYLRRGFRGMAWTFGSLKAFDARANRLEILNVLWRAQELAAADIVLARLASRVGVRTEPVKRAA